MSFSSGDLMALDKGEDLLDEVMRDQPDRRRLKAFIDGHYPLDQEDGKGRNAFLWAAARGFSEEAHMMLCRGVRLDKADEKGMTPLILAAQGGHFAIVKMLVEANVPINAQDNEGASAALHSLKNGFNEVTAYLVGAGAEAPPVDISTELREPARIFRQPLRMKRA